MSFQEVSLPVLGVRRHGHNGHNGAASASASMPLTLRRAVLGEGEGGGLENEEPSFAFQSRRDVLSLVPTSLIFTGGLLLGNTDSIAATAGAAEKWGSSPEHPVAVLGAGGRTGMEVARALAKEGIYAVTMTRAARDPYQVVKLAPEVKAYIEHFPDPVNVVNADSLKESLEKVHASAIIFCASSSRQGGDVFDVDYRGVENAALSAKALGARLVVITALAVTRPDSKSFQITNTLGGRLNGIMDAKRQGEERTREILSKTKDYVIVRPGPLLSGKTNEGPSGMELNQGDTIGGGLSRDELAGVSVGALLSGKRGVTVEAYRRKTATALQPDFKIPSGRERTADTYRGLFDSVEAD